MNNSNAIKADLLGMPFGTAQSRLKKKLVFYLAEKLEMLECFRCHQLIENLDEFSIEHTESWQYSNDPIETFFNVEKIAFSHLVCNVGAGLRPAKIESPEGMSWCYNCKRQLPIQDFPNGTSHNRPYDRCTSCNSQKKQEYRIRTGKR